MEKSILQRKIENNKTIDLKLAVHPHSNGIIVINYPGITGDIDGWENKYKKQANCI